MNSLILPASVTQTAPHPRTSSRYVHINTTSIIDVMQREGFQVAKASGSPRDFARHMIDFRLPDAPTINGVEPRILFINSHDGSTAATAMAGLFRLVCSNGLIVGNVVSTERKVHTGESADELIARMQNLARNTAPTFDKIAKWSRIELSATQRNDFARFAVQLRNGDAGRFEAEDVLSTRRGEDEGNDLWRVFNRVQENLVVGGIAGVSRNGRRTHAMPLKEVGANVGFNAKLWRLAEEFAE
jgi:Domain of unknown function (DUF932)